MRVALVIVAPEDGGDWVVSCDGWQQRHSFTNKQLASQYGRSWAEANRPCRVRVETREGQIETEFELGPYEPWAA